MFLKVFVTSPEKQEEMTVDVEATGTVKDIKRAVATRTGLEAGQMELDMAGIKLTPDEAKIEDLGLKEGAGLTCRVSESTSSSSTSSS